MAYTMESTLGELLKDPKVKPLLEQYVPGIESNPMLGMIKGMTVRDIVNNPLAQNFGIDEQKAQQLLDQANALVG